MPNSDWYILNTKDGIWVVRKGSPRCKILISDKKPKVFWLEDVERSFDEETIIDDAKLSDAWQTAELLVI